MAGRRVCVPLLVASLALLVVGLVLVVEITRQKCVMLSSKPQVGEYKSAANVPSNDMKALARLAGYIEYNRSGRNETDRDQPIYLLLDLKTVEHEHDQTTNLRRLNLVTYCSRFTLNLTADEGAADSRWLVSGLVEVSVSGRVTRCRVDLDELNPLTSLHFRCASELILRCNKLEPDNRVSLILQQFEFQLDGREDLVGNGLFAGAQPSSCSNGLKFKLLEPK